KDDRAAVAAVSPCPTGPTVAAPPTSTAVATAAFTVPGGPRLPAGLSAASVATAATAAAVAPDLAQIVDGDQPVADDFANVQLDHAAATPRFAGRALGPGGAASPLVAVAAVAGLTARGAVRPRRTLPPGGR